MPDLEKRIDALYALPPEEFTAARNALAAELKRTDAEAAARVRGLAKPNAAAAILNRLVRIARRDVDAFLEVGEKVQRAEAEALAGRGARSLREAADEERRAAGVLTKRAEILAREVGVKVTPALSQKLGDTLRAAVVDAEARENLLRGRLTTDLQRVGFGEAAVPVTLRPAKPKSAPATTKRDETRAREAEAKKEATQGERDLRAALREAESLETQVREAEQEAERTARDAEAAAQAAAAARQRLGEIRKRWREATKDAERAQGRLDRMTENR